MEYIYLTRGVCSRRIYINLDGEIIVNVRFEGGCNGNTKGLAAMVKGMNAYDVVAKLKGIQCAGKVSSCPDQLAHALEEILAKQE